MLVLTQEEFGQGTAGRTELQILAFILRTLEIHRRVLVREVTQLVKMSVCTFQRINRVKQE